MNAEYQYRLMQKDDTKGISRVIIGDRINHTAWNPLMEAYYQSVIHRLSDAGGTFETTVARFKIKKHKVQITAQIPYNYEVK